MKFLLHILLILLFGGKDNGLVRNPKNPNNNICGDEQVFRSMSLLLFALLFIGVIQLDGNGSSIAD